MKNLVLFLSVFFSSFVCHAVVAPITGSFHVCMGQVTTLENATPAGVWSSSNSAVGTVSATGMVVAVSTGTTTISYTVGAEFATAVVTVDALPAAITGVGTSLCAGFPFALSCTPAGGTWSSSAPAVGTISTAGVFTGIAGGSTTITYTVASGCTSVGFLNVNAIPFIGGNPNICIGTPSAMGVGMGLTWTTSNPSVAIVSAGAVTGVSAGTAIITVINSSTTCFNTSTVTVNPAPDVITGPADLCLGLTTHLSTTSTGGTWSSSNPTVAPVDGVGLVTGVALGTARISYTLPVSGCRRVLTVTVNPIPTILGNPNVCIGTTSVLSGPPISMWSSEHPSIATVFAGTVTGINPGTATIMVTTAAGCSNSTTVTVNPAVAPVTGNLGVCLGATTLLSAASTGGTWSSSNTVSAPISGTGVVTGVSLGTAYITYTTPASGCWQINMVTVNPLPAPIVGSDAFCNLSSALYTCLPPGGSWSSSNSTILAINSITGMATSVLPDPVNIIYTLPTGCSATKAVHTILAPYPITGLNSVCGGATITLNNAIGGGAWSSSSPGIASVNAAGVVTGGALGVATITYALSTGCYSTHTVTVSVLAAPITGELSFCSATGTTLSNTVTGGTWSSGNTAVAIVGTAGFVNAVSAGTATISYVAPSGCMSLAVVTVDATAPVTGIATVCTGLTTTLNHIVAGGTWISSNEAIATIGATGIVSGIAEGTVTITYTNVCGAFTKTVTVVGSIAPITGVMAICSGATTTLYNATPGGAWSSIGMPVAVNSSGVVVGLVSGTGTISYAVGTCGAATTIVTVHPVVPVITGPTALCVGASVTMSNASAGGTWSSSASIVTIGAATGVVTGHGVGSAVITYTLATGCSGIKNVTVNTLPSPLSGSVLCGGSAIALGNAVLAGTWASSNIYVAVVGMTTGIVSGVSSGTALISYTLPTGCSSSATVTVQPAVSGAISTISPVCAGSTATLSHPLSGGQWSSGNGSIATVGSASGIVTGVSAGTTTITYQLSPGCYSTRALTVSGPVALTGLSTLCTGYTTTFSSVTGAGTWASSNAAVATVNTTGVITGIGPGNATITYATGCGYATRNVAVSATAPLITGSAASCLGENTALYNAVAGGAWASSNPSVAAINPFTGSISSIAAGTALISYTFATCPAQTKSITVNPLPAAITGPATVCSGSTITLGNAVGGGAWSAGNEAIATVGSATGIVTGAAAGTVSILYALPTGCTVSKSVNVTGLPVITGDNTVCSGGSATLGATGGSGTWSGSNAAITVFPGGLVLGTSLGSTIVSFTAAAGGCTGVHTVTATSLCTGLPGASAAVASATSICAGSAVTLSLSGATVGCGIICQWQYADGAEWVNISGATNEVYTTVPGLTRDYRCALNCIASGLTNPSTPVTVSVGHSIAAYSIINTPDVSCGATHFYIAACGASTALSVVTSFGDATSSATTLALSGGYNAHVYHNYTTPGTYTVKQVLLNGGIAVDSVTFTYEHLYCRTLSVKFYKDNNTNCGFDAGDIFYAHPVITEIDSNGIPVDTIAATSGFYRKVYGAPGTVYGFRVLSLAGGLWTSCPSDGVLYDTIGIHTNTYATKYFGLQCGTSPAHDLAVTATMVCRPNLATCNMIISNANCLPVSPFVTFTFSDKYTFSSASIAPAAVAGNTVTWNLADLSAAGPSTSYITVNLLRAGPISGWLPLGDTIHSNVSVWPVTGDANPANNQQTRLDTVRASYDPNDIMVTPEGYILPCAQLQYRVRFENMGNDTAYNIHVLDTLSAHLDPSSLAPVVASAPMDISILYEGGYTIARFDFPNIKLLDSSHQDENKGMLVFNINARNGLPDNTSIPHRVGIYFDYSPVVMTNEVTNLTGVPAIYGPDSVCIGDNVQLLNAMPGGVWANANTSGAVADGLVSGLALGMDTISYTQTNSCISQTRTKEVFVNAIPDVAVITGSGALCAGATTTLVSATDHGVWMSGSTSVADIDAMGVVSGVAAGTAAMSYTVSNTCGSDLATTIVTVNPLVTPSVTAVAGISGVLCEGTPVVFYAYPVNGGSTPDYVWIVNGAMVSGGFDTFAYSPAHGDVVRVDLTSSDACAAPLYATDIATMSVTGNVLPSVSTTRSPSGTLCQGSEVTFTATPVHGGTAPAYIWMRNGAEVSSGSSYNFTPAHNDVVYCRLASSLPCILSDTVSGMSSTLAVDSAYVPVVSITANPGTNIVAGQSDTLHASVSAAGMSPTYQWKINGINIPGATGAVFISNTFSNGDSVSCYVTGSGVCAYHSFNSVFISVAPTSVLVPAGMESIVLAPNPNKGGFVIRGTFVSLGTNSVSFQISNLLGQMIYSRDIVVSAGNINEAVQLPNDLASGVYILNLRADNGNRIFRFVVDK